MLDRLFEKRALSFQSVFASGDNFQIGSQSGTIVNQDTAFQVNAIYSAVSLISQTISALPVDSYFRFDGARRPFRPSPEWVQQPDVDTTKEAFYGSVIVSLLLDGNAFIRIFRQQGRIVNLNVLNPSTVKIKRNGIGRVMFQVEGEDRQLSSEDILHIPDIVKPGSIRGVSRTEALKENFGLAIALQNYSAKFFGQGTNTSGVLEYPGNLTAEQAAQLQEGFDSRHRGWKHSHKTAVISGGATYKPTSVNPQDSQLLEARNHAVADIARAFSIPPHLLGLDQGMSYASVEQNNLAWVTHGLRPIVSKLEGGFSKLLKMAPGAENAFIKWNLDGLLRADYNTRLSGYSTGLQSGFFTINDIRRFEDLAPVDDPSADTVRVPLQNVNVENATISSQSQKVKMATALVSVDYDPSSVLQALDLPEIDHTGLPSVQLQGVQNLDPEDPESVYPETDNDNS